MILPICLIIIFSEAMLFAGYFWGAYHFIWSIDQNVESFILPSPKSLILIITLILASASVIISNSYCRKEKKILITTDNILVINLALLFMFIQISEYLNISCYINNNFNFLLFILTGLHFFHVLVGVILLLINFNQTPLLMNQQNRQGRKTNYLCLVNNQVELFPFLYWHFVEVLWLVIQYTFYTF